MSGQFTVPLNVDEFFTLNRRAFLRGLGASALVTATGGFFSRSVWGSPVFAAYPFALGVTSGEPATDGFVIWTKIALSLSSGAAVCLRSPSRSNGRWRPPRLRHR